MVTTCDHRTTGTERAQGAARRQGNRVVMPKSSTGLVKASPNNEKKSVRIRVIRQRGRLDGPL